MYFSLFCLVHILFLFITNFWSCGVIMISFLLAISLTITCAVEGRLDLSPDHSFKYCIGPNCSHNQVVSDEPVNCQKYTEKIDPTDCRYYFLCEDGLVWTRHQCPIDQRWNPVFQFCTPKDYVKCETRCGSDGKFRDNYDCRKFYVCIYRRAFSFNCGSGTVFDEKSGQCIEDVGTC